MTTFDRAADIYDQTRGFPPGVGEQVAAALIDFLRLTPEHRLLDIGVGTGRIARPLAAHLGPRHHLSGVDISRKMMARIGAALAPGVRPPSLAEADALRLPFAEKSFDAILTVHVLHLVRDWPALLREMQRVRAERGVFVGGWNAHPDESSGERINRKFRELGVQHGIPMERQGLSHYRDVLAHLPVRHSEENLAASWTLERTPRLALQSIADRHFSSAWLIPDEVFPSLYLELEAWAQREWPDLDQAILEQRSFKWMKLEFEPPAE
jgi:SAM-dependent methyltransferase